VGSGKHREHTLLDVGRRLGGGGGGGVSARRARSTRSRPKVDSAVSLLASAHEHTRDTTPPPPCAHALQAALPGYTGAPGAAEGRARSLSGTRARAGRRRGRPRSNKTKTTPSLGGCDTLEHTHTAGQKAEVLVSTSYCRGLHWRHIAAQRRRQRRGRCVGWVSRHRDARAASSGCPRPRSGLLAGGLQRPHCPPCAIYICAPRSTPSLPIPPPGAPSDCACGSNNPPRPSTPSCVRASI